MLGGQNKVDHELPIPMAKELCMIQRTELGRQFRLYFIKVEEAWNSPEAVMARALQFANRKLDEIKVENRRLLADKAKPMDSEINCPALTELLDGSLKYLCAYFEDGWRHSEEEAAEEIRTRTLELLHSISADILVRDMGTDMCEFVVRLSRWVRQ